MMHAGYVVVRDDCRERLYLHIQGRDGLRSGWYRTQELATVFRTKKAANAERTVGGQSLAQFTVLRFTG
jgi:hypothetical protein